MYEVNLAAALHLQFNSGAHQLLIELGDHGLYGHAIFGRSLDHAHVAQADQGHVQRARDRCCRHREHIDGAAHLFQPLLVAHAESLLFVDYQQAEVEKLDVLREQPMGADENVNLPLLCALQDFLLLFLSSKARDHFDVDGELREALLEGLEMLKGEDGRGREHGDLLAVLHGFEGCAHGYFRLAVANVAAEQAIHGACRFHIALDVGNGV